jgi:alkylated DNA repair dioxygenase AlkB
VLREDCLVELEERLLSPAQACGLEQRLRETLVWEQRSIVLFGKTVLQPRLIAWGGALPYRYSGQTLEPRPLTVELEQACRRVSARAGVEFNHVLVNRYRDGRDSMGWHADDEPELGADPPVATLSLGATRRFCIQPRRAGRARAAPGSEAAGLGRVTFELHAGSLLLMAGATQRHYVHSIPRAAALGDERISLTFRRILALA